MLITFGLIQNIIEHLKRDTHVLDDDGGNDIFDGLTVEEKERLLKWCLASEPKNKSIMCDIGYIYDWKENYVEAVKWYYRAIEMGDTDALMNIGHMYFIIGDVDRGLEFYIEAAEKGNPYANESLGVLYYSCGKIDLAIEWFKKGIALGSPGAYYGLAWLYYSENDSDWRKIMLYLKIASGLYRTLKWKKECVIRMELVLEKYSKTIGSEKDDVKKMISSLIPLGWSG
ncbi:MAG: hypothetical protein Hyperionvirus6_99 [Hyperionvirus sp.]|uniref:Tetratricopeptide repeat protein n=1 Tax=Hyperionvirus sp. TaxID=2487770 RepID=A0A3G5A895_9VIRU|nr:MAG: hypothetical protein Hyperionvirus6_99 [Hyperionvirus sp.]